MNKSKIILASVGGVVCLVSLVLAYLVWDALTVKGERAADLDGLTASADRLMRLPVYPGPTGVKACGENAATYAAWREAAVRAASAGDMTFEPTTPPAFKTFLVEEAARLSALPGGVDGKLVKPGFSFGFKDYITGGVLPKTDDLPRLQREWHDVATVIEALAAAGVVEITDVALTAPKPVAEERKETSRRDRRRNVRNRKATKDKPTGPAPLISTFSIEFLARPAAFVNAVNAFVTAQRFIVVDSFTFTRVVDETAEAIGGVRKKDAAEGRRGRGRRGRRAAFAEEEKKEEAASKKAFFTDPLTAAPLKTKMSFSVYDFRSLETKAEADEKTEEQK